MISQKSIDEVLETARIEDVVGEVVNLKRAGVNLKGLCPFHNEKTPSFVVSPGKNIYKCFGCGKGGDPLHFVMEQGGLTFPEAIRSLAQKYNIELEETITSDEARQESDLRESLYMLNDYAGNYYQDNLFQTASGKSIGLAYFKERGFLEKTIRQFGLGFSLAEADSFTQNAIRANYNPEFLKKLGLTTSSDKDFFRNRVIFPIHGINGKIVAFAGRIMNARAKAPKYINSPESEIYHKSKVLYGAWFAKNEIRRQDECILVEGYTDVISLHQSGIQHTVATSGTSLTRQQVQLIRRYTSNIKLLYDGDKAGLKAALRGVDIILEEDLNVRIVVLPDGEDPDSYLRKVGTSDFLTYLEQQAKDFIFFKTALLLDEAAGDPIKKADTIHSIVESIALVPDAIKRAIYIKECASMMDIQEEILVDETNKQLVRTNKKKRESEERNRQETEGVSSTMEEADVEALPSKARKSKPPATVNVQEVRERELVRVLVNFGNKTFQKEPLQSIAAYIFDQIEEVMDTMQNPIYQKIIQEIKKQLQEKNSINPAYFIGHTEEEIRHTAIELLTSPHTYSPNWEEKYGIILQTQKEPEENYIRDTEIVLKQFLIYKLNEMCDTNLNYIKELGIHGQDEEIIIRLRVQRELMERRNTLASELKQVVIRH